MPHCLRLPPKILFLASLLGSSLFGSSDPLTVAAEYYFTRYDYQQALQLWNTVLQRRPNHLPTLFRVAELKLILVGRPACRETFRNFLEKNRETISLEARRSIAEKAGALLSTFTTDDGQTLYLQALTRIRRKDCQSALGLLEQANALEKANPKILREKARCERQLGQYERLQETIQLAFEHNPDDAEILDNLTEAWIFHGEFEKVVSLYRSESFLLKTARQRLGFGYSLMVRRREEEALAIMRPLLEKEKQRMPHPIAHYAIGRILSSRPGSQVEAASYFERFVTALSQPENVLIEGWDPYRTVEKADEVRKRLQAPDVRRTPSLSSG